MPELHTQITALVRRIERHEAPDPDAEVAALVADHGAWVLEAITDALTAGGQDTYSQSLQDKLADKNLEMSPEDWRRLPIASLELGQPGPSLLVLLADLVPADLAAIRREALLTPVEYDVWRYWLDGYGVPRIATWVRKHNGSSYATYSVRLILQRAQAKISQCPSLGWRTCLAEDIARGRIRRIPRKATIGRLVGQAEEPDDG